MHRVHGAERPRMAGVSAPLGRQHNEETDHSIFCRSHAGYECNCDELEVFITEGD